MVMGNTGKQPRITLYSTPGCPHCRSMKRWLRSRRIPFREEDISRSRRAFREFQELGGRGVPLLRVGNRNIRGFDPARLEEQLRKTGVLADRPQGRPSGRPRENGS